MDGSTTIFWALIAGLLACVVALVYFALRRAAVEAQPAAAFDLQVYRDQLAEVDRDLARGIVNEDDADRARTEISRRILAADAALQAAQQSGAAEQTRSPVILTGALGALVVLGSLWIYTALGAPGYGDLALADRMAQAEAFREQRPSQADAEASLSASDLPPAENLDPDYVALVTQLREVVAQRPGDLQGLRLLAISERNLGNFSQAHAAFARYLDARGPQADPQEFADLADMLILAAGGYVSPEAEIALARALDGDPANAPARYYWGLMLSQTGRPDQTVRIWDALLRAGPADAPWIPPVQAQIEEVALRAGMNYAMPEPGTAARGPSAEDIANASELTPSERMEMISGMVEGLAGRLASEGGPVEDWAQLIRALGVLERRTEAYAIYENALSVFADDLTAIDIIKRAADRAGVAN